MALPKIKAVITADTKEAEDGFKRVSSGLGDVEGASRKAMSAVKAFAAGLVSIAAIGTVFSKSVAEAQKFETTMFRIQAVIKATGGAAGRTAQELRSFAENLALNTLESTEGILEAQQRLLTFRKVSGDVFDRTIAVAADLSAVLGTNMSGAAIQLGRALEDPVTGLTALTRTGTVFTDSQKEMVKQLVESGRLLEAQSFILDELEAQYGGAAVAAAQGYAGALDTLGQRIQEFFLSVDENLGLTKALSAVYLAAADAIKVVTDNMARLVAYIGTAATASIAYAAFMARGWVAAFVAARVATFSLAAALTTLRAALIRTGIGALVVALGEGVYQFSRISKAAGGFGAAIALVGEVFSEVWGRMKEGVRLVGVMFEGAGEIVEDAFSAAFSFIEREFNNRVVRPITGGLNTIIKAANAIGGNFSELDMPPLVLEDITTGGEGRGMAKITGAASELGTLLDEPLESVQKIRDLLASIKDERITLPDLLGVGSDEDGGGKKKTPLEEQTDLQIQALKDLKDQGRDTWSALGTFLQQFAGKSKAAAIAVIAINKGLAIAQAIQNTAVAYTKALIADPTGTLSARVAALGKIQVGLIAATGLAQAATAGASSGGGTSGGATGASSAASAPAMPTQTVSINLQGDTFSRGSVEGLLEQIQSQLDRGGRLVFQ